MDKFKSIIDYKDSKDMMEKCQQKIYNSALDLSRKDNISSVHEAMDKFTLLNSEGSSYKDAAEQIEKCTKRISELKAKQELEENATPILTVVVLDSINPLALANGAHYVYKIKENNRNISYEITFDLVNGKIMRELKMIPGKYTINLYVYGCDTTPSRASPMFSTSREITLAPFEKWQAISNRPGLFTGLRLSIKKQK